MAKAKKNVSACSSKIHGYCTYCTWILPLIIVGLIWFAPMNVLWTKIVITVIIAMMMLNDCCSLMK